MRLIKSIIAILIVLFSQSNLFGSTNTIHQSNVFNMETLSDSTLHEGLAGTYFGKHGDWLILAGGSNFPNGKPWENGVKRFSDKVFVFTQQADRNLQMIYMENSLPIPLAEGAYVSIPDGVLCIGGLNSQGLTEKTWLLSFNGSSIKIEEYPPLPFAIKHSAATVIGTNIYLIGGELSDGSFSNKLLTLDISNLNKGWEVISDFIKPVSGASIVSQQDGEEMSLFVFGGRAKVDSNITSFYSSVYQFRPSSGKWLQRGDIRLNNGTSLSLSMASASSIGGSHIILYGGDTGDRFNQIEIAANNNEIEKRDSLQMNHTGFNEKILVYNTITDSWFEVGNATNPPVAVSSVMSNGSTVYIVSGEIRPGVRSPLFTRLDFTSVSHFGWLNYLVLFVYFGGMLLIGFYFMKRNKNTDDFFKASGRIPWWAAGISIFATTLSAITFLSIPAKTYATDWRMLIFNITIVLIVPIVIRYFIPFFTRLKLGTAYEYLEIRFSRIVRWLASALFICFMISRIAIVLFLPALALHAVTGFDIYLSIIVMGMVTIIYSTSGGMEAVIWGDVVQGAILVFGALTAFILMIVGIEGGFNEFWNTSIDFNKFRAFDLRFDLTQPTFWVVLIGGISNNIITYTSDQSIVQRYMSTKNEKATARSVWLNGFLSLPVTLVFFLIGTALFAFYKDNPANMMITNPNIDSVFPQFIVNEMPTGVAGLLIAAIFAAAMSTLSSNINSSAAVITCDFYQTMSTKSSHKSQLGVARRSGLICGLLGMCMALVLATWNITSLWDQFNTFLGLLTSGLGALFILGIFFPRVDHRASLTGVISGLIVLLLVKSNVPLSFLLYGFIGLSSSVIIAYLASFIFLNKKNIDGYTWQTINKEVDKVNENSKKLKNS